MLINRNKEIFVVIIAFFMMLWNFNYKIHRSIFENYTDSDCPSDTLVSGTIYADYHGLNRHKWVALGLFSGLLGDMYGYERFLTDQNWENGYNRRQPTILVKNTGFTRELFKIGHSVEFQNGESFSVQSLTDFGSNLGVNFQADKILSEKEHGNLFDIKVRDESGNLLPLGTWNPYFSQFGLHGRVFRKISKLFPIKNAVPILHFLCGFMTALTLTLICYFIFLKFDFLFSLVFYVVFFASPWVVGIAQNLYWIEFSLFLPMLCGLICSYQKDNKTICGICYASAFVLIFLKSLCGFEYMTTILISLVSFPLMDLAISIFEKDKKSIKRDFRNVFFLGIFGLLGFSGAFLIHSYFLGNENILEGLRIQKANAVRRISGQNLISEVENLTGRELEAVFAGRFETFMLYFKWHTVIITEFSGDLFSILCLVPIFIFANDFKKKKIDFRLPVLYVLCFLAPASWFFIAKDHSYVHTHLNFVLWYFGFIQVCFYVILKKCKNFLENLKK